MLKGLIFTDTYVLAKNLSVQQEDIQSVLLHYVSQCASYIEWHIVDIADSMYADTVDSEDWLSYDKVLTDYYYGLGLNEFQHTPLFIIGGVNEIPMPIATNPLAGSHGGENLCADMLYCFDYQDKSTIAYSILINQTPRFVVGRLPLSSQHTIIDLEHYLDNCITYLISGIHVRGAAMITTESWLAASTDMMRDIPTCSLSTDNVPLNNRMIVSPPLDTTYKDMYDGFVHELSKVDFLVCNLHGSDIYEEPQFFGDNKYCAIQPSMLSKMCPPIFNTAACYGARFIEYSTPNSMLYSAFQNGTMLYLGACDIALGGCDRQASCSELLIKLYNIYLHQGIPAGMALLKAKQAYYRTCHYEDRDENAMFTILEFNLFGCPILFMQPKLSLNYRPQLLGQYIVNQAAVNYQPTKIVPLKSAAFDANDILLYIRQQVDTNLSYIRNKVEKEVYERFGLGKNNLECMSLLIQNGSNIGWQFIYTQATQEWHNSWRKHYLVYVNEQGKITKVLHTKQ